jgi:hypothetical protein
MVRESRPNASWVSAPRPAWEAGGGPVPRLTVFARSLYRAAEADLASVDASGTYLVYDPDTGVADNEMVIARDTVTAFTCEHLTNSNGKAYITAYVELQDEDTVQSTIEAYFRNEAN